MFALWVHGRNSLSNVHVSMMNYKKKNSWFFQFLQKFLFFLRQNLKIRKYNMLCCQQTNRQTHTCKVSLVWNMQHAMSWVLARSRACVRSWNKFLQHERYFIDFAFDLAFVSFASKTLLVKLRKTTIDVSYEWIQLNDHWMQSCPLM